jgi:hypothetical protein
LLASRERDDSVVEWLDGHLGITSDFNHLLVLYLRESFGLLAFHGGL